MKRTIFALLLLMASAGALRAADGDLFPYPQPPADMERLDERCDFIISRFWRQADFKSAMSKTEKLRSTFSDWISLMPYATSDTVFAAIDRLIASVAKSGPQTLALARMAEEFAYSDTSDIRSAEVFLPFARAAADHKKIPGDDRAHFASLIRRIENVQPGKPVGHLEFISPDGSRRSLANFRTQMVAVVFAAHNDSDASLARVRLSADYSIKTLIDHGLLTLIFIEPGPASPEWLQATASYPASWQAGAMPDAEDWFELRTSPCILLLDGRHKVLARDIDVEGLMAAMSHMRQQSGL